jgi:hypothetical protein
LPTGKPRASKRDVILALALGGAAAAGAGAIVANLDDDEPRIARADEQEREVTFSLSGFDEVTVSGPLDVAISYGEDFSVMAEGPSGALDRVQALVEDGRLLIGPRDGLSFGEENPAEVTFRITMPRIERLALDGPGEVLVDRVRGEAFAAVLNGSGDIVVESLEADRADLALSGSGDFRVAGAVREVAVTLEGSGDIDASELRAATANVSLTGSGDVTVPVSGEAIVSMTGSGDVDIPGTATCSITSAGSGEVRCGGE